MSTKLINKKMEVEAQKRLGKYYENKMIPAEKKAYLTNLRESTGPFLGIEEGDGHNHFLMDAASQIATLGLGFNPGPFFGTSHFLESWTNDDTSEDFANLRKSFNAFLARKLDWDEAHTTLCHSGAEANEIALGYCYRRRSVEGQKKVLVFEGSFHGRMLVSLCSTWNESKRAPFQWEGYESLFIPHPTIRDNNIKRNIPNGWREYWESASSKTQSPPKEWLEDSELATECEILGQVACQLSSKEIFAILIEPMQCEGGDNFSTERFHTGLLILSKIFNVPLIYDEVQTGYHLGRDFFWHKMFDTRDSRGRTLSPDYVVCAKKAQVGMVISPNKEACEEEFQVASAIRGYIHAMMMDQSHELILKMEQKADAGLQEFVRKHSAHLENPRTIGISFAFDLKDKSKVNEFIDHRFDHGLLYYPAGSNTMRFRLNLGFDSDDIDFLFERLDLIAEEVFNGKKAELPRPLDKDTTSARKLYQWHEFILGLQLKTLANERISPDKYWPKVEELALDGRKGKLHLVDNNNFERFKQPILDLQKSVYEPARQTSLPLFEVTAKDAGGIALVLELDGKIAGIAFSSPLKNFPLERGVRKDPHFSNPRSIYMVDTTLSKEFQGKGIGKDLKFALAVGALLKGQERINGRNRDRLAAGMLSINLSLGSYELFHIKEDYPDFEKHRDVIYYTNPIKWKRPEIQLSRCIESPVDADMMDEKDCHDSLPVLVNKICLSNFVSEQYLSMMKDIFGLMPEKIRHGYSASGQSECVDKVIKSLWVKANKNKQLVTFDGHWFGEGSFLSRALSGVGEAFFPTKRFPHPSAENGAVVLKELEQWLSQNPSVAIFVEPVLQKTMERVDPSFLAGLIKLGRSMNTPVIFNETASAFRRWSENSFYAAEGDLTPHGAFCYMGGQSAMVFLEEELFLEDPLMMISTWDGDEFSMGRFHKAAMSLENNIKKELELRKKFQKELEELLKDNLVDHQELINGAGYFEGFIPNRYATMFKRTGNRFLVRASSGNMQAFINMRKG